MNVLNTRDLNRALLARQSLLDRGSGSAEAMIRHLVGMQAQAPFPPYYGLWTRLRDFQPEELSELLLDRRVARLAVMRGTVHLVTADDAMTLRPLTQRIMDTDLRRNSTYAPKIAGVDLDRLARETRASLADRPHTTRELGEALTRLWPDHAPTALVYAARNLLPLVQVPPRAVWGRSGATAYATAEDWLGRPLDPRPDLEQTILRYLAAFGPATVRDIQAWCGLTRLGEVVDRLRPRLCTFRTEDGRELVDVPGAPRPDAATPAPPRFVPEFDNLLLSHADRTRVASDADRARLNTRNGLVPGAILVDGFVSGKWKLTRSGRDAVLAIEAFRRLSTQDTESVLAEGERLLRFAGASDGEVRLTQAA